MKKTVLIVIILLLGPGSVFADGQFVQKVLNIDLLRLLDGEQVKLIGIEVDQGQKEQAMDFIRSLVSGSVVALEYDVEKRDPQGNLLAYVWFEYEPPDDKDRLNFPENFDVHYVVDEEGEGSFYVLLNTTVVKAGYAKPQETLPNSKYSSLLNKIYEENVITTAKAISELDTAMVGWQ